MIQWLTRPNNIIFLILIESTMQLQSSLTCRVLPKMHSCQAVLLKMVEDWKKALDNYQHTGIIVIDLSKAFDLPDKKI